MNPMSPVAVDGWIYVLIAIFGTLTASFSSDDAGKYIPAMSLFYIKSFCAAAGAGCLALKMYRSTTFAEYKQAKNGTYHTGGTDQFTKDKDGNVISKQP
jgi:hypothetical protein